MLACLMRTFQINTIQINGSCEQLMDEWLLVPRFQIESLSI